MIEISKELIKAVLQKETKTLSKDFNFTINEDYIEFSDDGEMQFEYCIYKFAFKCKEWALSVNEIYYISSWTQDRINRGVSELGVENTDTFVLFTAKTEIEAIIKACEWILNNKESL